jgi:hypothetical protein
MRQLPDNKNSTKVKPGAEEFPRLKGSPRSDYSAKKSSYTKPAAIGPCWSLPDEPRLLSTYVPDQPRPTSPSCSITLFSGRLACHTLRTLRPGIHLQIRASKVASLSVLSTPLSNRLFCFSMYIFHFFLGGVYLLLFGQPKKYLQVLLQPHNALYIDITARHIIRNTIFFTRARPMLLPVLLAEYTYVEISNCQSNRAQHLRPTSTQHALVLYFLSIHRLKPVNQAANITLLWWSRLGRLKAVGKKSLNAAQRPWFLLRRHGCGTVDRSASSKLVTILC